MTNKSTFEQLNSEYTELEVFDKIKKSTNDNEIRELIDSDSKFKEYLKKEITERNKSYLDTYKKYGVNIESLQQKLVDLGYSLGSFGPNKNGVDGKFGVNTFIAIINLQKALGSDINGITSERLLKFLYPEVFKTLNKKDGRSVDDTKKFVLDRVGSYNEILGGQKDILVKDTKKKVNELYQEILLEDTGVDLSKKLEIEKEIQKTKELKKQNNIKFQKILTEIEEIEDKISNFERLNQNVNNDWNPFNDDKYKLELEELYSKLKLKKSEKENNINEGITLSITLEQLNDKIESYLDDKVNDKNDEVTYNLNKFNTIEKQQKHINYLVKKGDTIWGVLMDKTGSEKIAALSNGIKIFPGDKIKITNNFINVLGKNGEYVIDINEGRYDFFPKFKMKKTELIDKKKNIENKKQEFIKEKKEGIRSSVEKGKGEEYLVKKGDLLRRIIYKHYNNHKIANLFNSFRVNIGDKIIFHGDHVELIGKKINEVILLGSEREIKEIENEDINKFMQLSISERLDKVTKKGKDGYLIIDFNKSFDKKTAKILEKKISINDIIPNQFNACEVLKNSEIKVWKKGRKKIAHKNYFDIVYRDAGEDFKSNFSGRKYRTTVIKNGYAIKPFVREFDSNIKTITNSESKNISLQTTYKNELLIRNVYGEKISNYINKYFKQKGSVIGEDMFYSLLKQESGFDPNALSHTGTRGLAMITLDTTIGILKRNKRLLANKKYLDKNPGIEELLIDNVDSITNSEKFEKYNHTKGYFHGVDAQFYNPLTSIKLSLSYLMDIEQSLSFIKNKTFKKDAILATYNAGTVIRTILKKHKYIDSWEKLKIELKKELPEAKYKEVTGYVNIIRKTY